jgi:5-oxoprolinase (ATP-hydrolysing)
VTDALFRRDRPLAPSQGTMNNFTFGNAQHQYYETICAARAPGRIMTRDSACRRKDQQPADRPRYLETRLPCARPVCDFRRGSGGPGPTPAVTAVAGRSRSSSRCAPNILADRRRVPDARDHRAEPMLSPPQLGRAQVTG